MSKRQRAKINPLQYYEVFENDLNFLGLVALEDQLQHEVPETLFSVKQAGIKVWILTGDKIETTKSIARACNLIEKISFRFKLCEKTFEDLESKLKSGLKMSSDGIDLTSVDGTSFALASSTPETEQMLLDILINSNSVIFARLSPAQKA